MKFLPDLSHWKTFTPLLQLLMLSLSGCYVVSLAARWHWLADLFSHFTLQYAIGSLLALAAFLLLRRRKWAAFALLIALLNVVEIYRHVDFAPLPPADAPVMTIVHYNRNVGSFDQKHLEEWLVRNHAEFDVVVIQEANASIRAMAGRISEQYPYQILAPRDDAFGMVVLSRHEFMAVDKINFPDLPYRNFASRFVFQPPGFSQPAVIFALHAMPPLVKEEWQQRNIELHTIATYAGADETPHRLMVGDWNITPYSPFFADIVTLSRLRLPLAGPAPAPTWPARGFPWLMQIPIDHMLASPSLRLSSIRFANPASSDHLALIATFAENKPLK